MFLHATATSWSKHDHAIHQGRREPLVEQDLGVEHTAMELICPDSTWEDIADLYQDVYQLWRLPGRSHCKDGTEEHICQEILDSLKEHLQLKQLSALLEGEWVQSLAGALRPGPQAAFAVANCKAYERFAGADQDSCEDALAIMQDTHWRALVAAALLEEKIEIEPLPASSPRCYGSCWHSTSHRCWRSQSLGYQGGDPQAAVCCWKDSHQQHPQWRGTVWGWTQSPSPAQQKWRMTFVEGKAPSPARGSPESDEAYQMPPLAQSNHLGPLKGVPISSLWRELISGHCQANHQEDRGAHHYTTGGDTSADDVWLPVPMPSTRVCGDCVLPVGGQPAISYHWDSTWRGQPPSHMGLMGSWDLCSGQPN